MEEHTSSHQHNVIFVSAQYGVDKKLGRVLSSIESQTRQSLENIVAAIAPAGLGKSDIATCRIYITNPVNISVAGEVYEMFFEGVKIPPKSIIGVSFLPHINDAEIMIGIEAVVIQK